MRLRSLFVLIAITLCVGACGSSTSDNDASTGTDGEAAPAQDASDESASGESATEVTDNSSDDSIESPIAELFGLPVGDADAFDEQIEEIGRAVERSVATCMLAEGFEYTPVDYSNLNSAIADIDFESRAFAEEWGFGIATGLDQLFFDDADSGLDPNIEYISSLSDGERTAYNIALYGIDIEAEGSASNDFEPLGCLGEAFEQSTNFFVLFETFGDELEALEEGFRADPRIVEASGDWSGCMSEAGYGYGDVDAAYADIQQQYRGIVSNVDADEIELDPETGLPPGEFPSFSPEVQAEIDELADVEREVAVASWDCEAPARALEEQVRVEYEREFVEEYGDAVRAELGN